MASFTSSAGTKRVRPWDSCHDVEKLKEMLEDREAEIESFKKLSAIQEEHIVKKLHQTLQEKEGRIEQLMREVEKSKAVSAFGKVFDASLNMASKDVCVDAKKSMSPFGNVFTSVQEPSKKMICETYDCQVSTKTVCVDAEKTDVSSSAQKALKKRHASLQKSKCVAADSEEDLGCDEGLASDSTDDEDYTVKETAPDSTDDEDYTAAFTKQSRGKAKKINSSGRSYADDTEKVFNGNVANLRASIQKQIVSQMVYRSGLKYRTSKAVAEVPNLTEAHMKAILGDDLFAKASRKGKLIQVTASDDDVATLFHGPFTKRLRYGAVLTLCDGLKFAFTKATGILKVTGVFSM